MRFLLCAALLLTTGCYATKSVSSDDFRSLGGNLDDTRSVRTARNGGTPIDARSLVRLHPARGTPSDWIPASDLLVSKDAIYLEAGIASSDLAAATVGNVSPEQVDRLRELAPAGGAIAAEPGPLGETYRLTASAHETLLPWLARFVSDQRERGASEGVWHLETRRTLSWRGQAQPTSFSVSFDAIAGRLTGEERLFVASGVRWSDLQSLDVNSLHPVFTALTIPLFWVEVFFSRRPNLDDAEKPILPPTIAAASRRVWQTDESGAQPLFAWQGKRRTIVKLLGGLDGGAEYGGSFYSSALVGLRLRNLFELGFVVRELSKAGGVNVSRRTGTLMGFAAGLHVDGDGDPGFAFYVGIESTWAVSGRTGGMTSLVLGPRFGFRNGLYLMLVPLGTTTLCRSNVHGSCVGGPGGIYSALQLGFAY